MARNDLDRDWTRQAERVSLFAQWRDLSHILTPTILISIAALWLASRFVEPAPPGSLVMSTGGTAGAYHAFGQRYADILARSGIRLEARPSAGSVENVRRLSDPGSNVSIALLQGGITNGRQSPHLVSLGRVFLEPVWVFYRREARIERLADLKGKRIAIGAEGSGTRVLAEALLEDNGVVEAPGTSLSPLSGQPAADAMASGSVDAVFLVMAPEAAAIQGLLRNESFGLLSFEQAEAYARLFPFLEKVTLPRGVVDLAGDIPRRDVSMLAATATLVARSDLHPALVGLLVDAAQEVHSGGGLFHRAGDFPRTIDPEFPMSDDALRIYKSGQSFLKRHLPFWLATFIERSIVMLVPIATILLPLLKIVPFLYQWRIKRRLFYWCQQLKLVERRMLAGQLDRSQLHTEIDRIEQAVRVIPVPIAFSDQLYILRSAIDLVRQRVQAAT